MLSILKESEDDKGILRKKSVSVPNPLTDEDKKLGFDMYHFLKGLNEQYPEGQTPVGLAAPQVGINKRIFVINLPEEYNDLLSDNIFINPIYLYKSFSKQEIIGESCLSVDKVGEDLIVKRSEKIKICFLTIDGERKFATITGFLAGIIQHEIDHLDGKLFYDKAYKKTKK